MLDIVLKQIEHAGVAAVSARLGDLLDEVTRRRSAFAPPVSPWYGWNIAARPAEATGHPHSDFEAVIEVSMQAFGRDTNGTRAQDRVRFVSDLAFTAVMADPASHQLFAAPETWSYEMDISIDEGSTVYLETILARVKRRDILAAGLADGIVERFAADFANPGTANAALSVPVVHAVGLDVLATVGDDIEAIFAGCAGDTSEDLRLVAEDGTVVHASTITAAAGTETISTDGAPAGTYTFRIVSGAATLAESLPIQFIKAP